MKYPRAMKLIRVFLAAASLTALCTASAQAQFVSLFVSSSGSDSAACNTPAAACATMGGAQSKAADGATIACVNPGFFGGIAITKSLTIDCLAGGGGVNVQFVTVDGPGINVRLRNLAVNGFGISIGVDIFRAASVHVENVTVGGFITAAVRDRRTGPGKLLISDSNIALGSGPGIVVVPQGGTAISAVLDNVRVSDSNYGVAVGSGGLVMIKRSVFAGNSSAGIEADPGAFVAINESEIAANSVGIFAGGTSAVVISNSDIVSNNFGISGPTRTFGNNRIFANTSDGPLPSAMGSLSSENGQR